MEICAILTACSPNEALGVVSAVLISHDDIATTLEVSVTRSVADARVVPVWPIGARVTASFEWRKHTLRIRFIVCVCVTLILLILIYILITGLYNKLVQFLLVAIDTYIQLTIIRVKYATVLSIWSSVARVSASFDGRNNDSLSYVFNVYVCIVLIVLLFLFVLVKYVVAFKHVLLT